MSETPAANAETRIVPVPGVGDRAEVLVEVEMPAGIVDECRDDDGNVDKDLISDRIGVVPTVDGRPV